jgi:hypothetical protein
VELYKLMARCWRGTEQRMVCGWGEDGIKLLRGWYTSGTGLGKDWDANEAGMRLEGIW